MPAPKMPIARPRRSGREPGVDERDADREDGAGDAEEEAADEQQRVGVEGDEGDEEDRHDGGRGDDREHHATAVAVRHRPDHDPAERADQHRHSHQKGDVRLAEVAQRPGVAEHRAERADERPGPEVHREPERGQGQHQDRRPGSCRRGRGCARRMWPGGRVVRHSDDSVSRAAARAGPKVPAPEGSESGVSPGSPAPSGSGCAQAPPRMRLRGRILSRSRGNVPDVISDLVLGTMYFGTRTDRDSSFALLDRFVEAGGRWIDTANCYAFWADRAATAVRARPSSATGSAPTPASASRSRSRPRSAWSRSTAAASRACRQAVVRAGADGQPGAARRRDHRPLLGPRARPDDTPIEETVEAMGDPRRRRHRPPPRAVQPPHLARRARTHPRHRPGRSRPCTALQLSTSYVEPRPGAAVEGKDHRFGWVTEETRDYVEQHPEVEVWAYSPLDPGRLRPRRTVLPRRPTTTPVRRPGWRPSATSPDGWASRRASSCSAWLVRRGTTPILGVSSLEQLESALARGRARARRRGDGSARRAGLSGVRIDLAAHPHLDVVGGEGGRVRPRGRGRRRPPRRGRAGRRRPRSRG